MPSSQEDAIKKVIENSPASGYPNSRNLIPNH